MKLHQQKNPFKLASARRRVASVTVAMTILLSFALGAIAPVVADTKLRIASGKGSTDDQKIIHLLNRIGFGPRPGDLERVRAMGVDKYIDQQLHPDRIDDAATEARLKGIESIHMSRQEIAEKYPEPGLLAREIGLKAKKGGAPGKPGDPANPNAEMNQANDAPLDLNKQENRQMLMEYYRDHNLKPPQLLLQDLMAQKIIRAVYSDRQLQEVMSDFWFNHFNIFFPKGADKTLTTDYEMSAIRPHTLGKFKDLVMATAKSPAMLFYLDNFQSSAPDAQLPRPGGNRGRFMRRGGLFGGGQGQMTPEQQERRRQAAQQFQKRKPGINENYARELMELHTLGVEGGYTQKDVQEVARCLTGWTIDQPRRGGGFVYRPWMHDNNEKTVLGQKIPAGGGEKDGEMVIDILTRHPSTAKFISTKLARRFVSDNPPPALVNRLAQVYTKTDGDIREMLRTIFTSPEFNAKEAYRAKIKSPFELAVSAIRALNGETVNTMLVAQFITKMGQPLYRYQPPTGFPDRAEQWVNTGALLERLNFGLALSANKLRGTTVDLKRAAPGVDSRDKSRVMDRAIALLLFNDVSPQTRAVLEKQLRDGVPVKGELDNSPGAMKRDEQMDDGSSLLAEGTMTQPQGKGDKIARYDYPRGRQARLENRALQTVALTPDEAEMAKVFGLVLGSPEFQRR